MDNNVGMAQRYEHEIPEGYEARIDGNKVILEPKESEDERIYNLIYSSIKNEMPIASPRNKELALAYLEKQKEQKSVSVFTFDDILALESAMNIAKHDNDSDLYNALQNIFERVYDIYHGEVPKPAEWSEEFLRLMGITISQDGNQVCVLLGENLAEGIAAFGDTLADAVEEFKKEWRQFDRFRNATWKPSKEQMNALNAVANEGVLLDLFNDLLKLF